MRTLQNRIDNNQLDPAVATVIRLAVDGMYFNHLYGMKLSDEVREKNLALLACTIAGGIQMNGYVFLGLAIAFEVFSTSMLKASAGFTKLLPSLAFLAGMATSFYAVSQAMLFIPLNIAYAIWAGVGTALTALVAIVIWKEPMNFYTAIGIALIIAGVAILNLKGAAH